jgi:hypothetical protein
MHRNMDVSLDSVTLPAWMPEKAAEWDEAFEKVENYLRACRVSSRLHRARLAAMILQRALAQQSASSENLTTLAIGETRAMIAQWMSELLQRPGYGRQVSMDEAYLALYLCDAPMRWPNAFLNPREEPPGFSETLHGRLVKTGPELEVSSMVPRPLDRGLIQELAGSAMETLERFPIIKTLFIWLIFAALLVALFLRTRH